MVTAQPGSDRHSLRGRAAIWVPPFKGLGWDLPSPGQPEGENVGPEELETDGFGDREIEILQLIAKGPIKGMLVISGSPQTVGNHCEDIVAKLDVHDAAGLSS